MPNPFYAAPVTSSTGDTSPGGGAPQAATVIDNTYSAGNPFATQAPSWQQGIHTAKYNTAVAQTNDMVTKDSAPTPLLTTIGDTITGLPRAASDILSNTAQHPLQTGESVLGGLMDVGPAAVNVLSHVGLGMLKSIYGAAGLHSSDQPIDLPLPGQTVNEYIGNNSDVSQAEQQAAKMVGSYELGGAAARGIGLGGVTVDALGNTIPRATLASRVAGNVIGGQLITDPNATLADRTKQAAFDTAFGVADTAARAVAGSLKATKLATAAVSDAKNGVMNSAISSFEDASNPAYNPDVATKLRTFLGSKTFDGSKNMVDFETNLQKALGDDFNDATVKTALQPIIDAGHQQVAQAVSVNTPKPVPKKFAPSDLVGTLDDAQAKLDATPKDPPKTKYIPKANLGTDEYGNKKLATTQVDTHTGNAIVYYDKTLDANPDAKKIVFDHEQGHIIDKRLNGGNNISAIFGNYVGNKTALDASLGDFAKHNSMTVPEAAANLKADIAALSGGKGEVNEQFADAVSAYRADPAASFEKAPTFSKLMNYVPQDGAISERSTSLEGLKQDSPIAGKMVDQKLSEAATEAKNTAPTKIAATGLDTGRTVEGKVSFNPDKINAPQEVESLFNKMDAENASFSDQRTAKSNEDIKDLARLVGLKPEDLIGAKPGSIANAETLTAARQLVLNKAQSFVDNLKGIDVSTASDAELKGLKDDYTRLVAMQQTVAGLRTEAANTLRSLSIEVQPGEDFTLKQSFEALQNFGTKMGWDTSAFAGKVGDDMQQTRLQKIATGAMKTWYASILSGPATYLRHFIGVETNQFMDIISKGFNPKTMTEFPTALRTAFKSVPEAWAEMKKTFGSNEENPNFDEIKNAPVFAGKNVLSQSANTAIEFTGRAMTSLASGYSKIAEEVEKASTKVSSPQMSDDVANALSKSYAESINYLGEPKGFIAQRMLAGAQALTRGAYNPLRLVIPFTRVVTNIIDRQFDYIPGTSAARAFNIDSGLTQQTDAIMTKYGLTSDVDRTAIFQRLKDQQIGRMVMGMALTVPVALAAKAGLVSGSGPSDYNQKVELEQTGWRPDSVKIGNVWVPSAFLGPVGGLLMMAGNISDAAQYDKSIDSGDYFGMVSKGLLGWGQSQINKSFLSGVSNLLAALSDPSKAATYFKNLGAELLPIPKIASFAVGAVKTAEGDNYLYQTNGVIDKIRSELGLTGTVGGTMLPLEPQQDAFGRPLKADLIYGLQPSLTKADKIDSYLQANDIVITIPNKGTQYTDPESGKKTKLTGNEYNDYVTKSGKLIYQNLAAMIPELQGEDIDRQRAEIRSMLDSIRTEVRGEVMSTKK